MSLFARVLARASSRAGQVVARAAPSSVFPMRFFAASPVAQKAAQSGTSVIKVTKARAIGAQDEIKLLERERKTAIGNLTKTLEVEKKRIAKTQREAKLARKTLMTEARKEKREIETALRRQKKLLKKEKMRVTAEKTKLKKKFTQTARIKAATPPRTPNGFALYYKDAVAATEQSPELQPVLPLVEARAKWNNLSDDVRQRYKDAAARLVAKRHENLKKIPKRPATSYFRFAKEFNATHPVSAATQKERLAAVGARAKQASAAWKALDAAAKTKFQQEYRKAYDVYKVELAKFLDDHAPIPAVIKPNPDAPKRGRPAKAKAAGSPAKTTGSNASA